MSTATKEGVEKGDTEDANIPTSNMGYEDDTMSDAGGNIAPFTASPKNETSPPTQGIVTASTGQDSDADNIKRQLMVMSRQETEVCSNLVGSFPKG